MNNKKIPTVDTFKVSGKAYFAVLGIILICLIILEIIFPNWYKYQKPEINKNTSNFPENIKKYSQSNPKE